MDIPQQSDVTTSLFPDDTAIVARHKEYNVAVSHLQAATSPIASWAQTWEVLLNEAKSIRVDFSLGPHSYVPTVIQGKPVPKYLGLHLDAKLNWQEHIRNKLAILNLTLLNFRWLIGLRSNLSLKNKVLIFKTVFQPAWSYGSEIWGAAAKSNIRKIEVFVHKYLRTITGALWYMTNQQLRLDLGVVSVFEVIKNRTCRYIRRLHDHPNVEPIRLLSPMTPGDYAVDTHSILFIDSEFSPLVLSGRM